MGDVLVRIKRPAVGGRGVEITAEAEGRYYSRVVKDAVETYLKTLKRLEDDGGAQFEVPKRGGETFLMQSLNAVRKHLDLPPIEDLEETEETSEDEESPSPSGPEVDRALTRDDLPPGDTLEADAKITGKFTEVSAPYSKTDETYLADPFDLSFTLTGFEGELGEMVDLLNCLIKKAPEEQPRVPAYFVDGLLVFNFSEIDAGEDLDEPGYVWGEG